MFRLCGRVILFIAVSTQAFGAGYEKDTYWSGRYTGQAGAAVSSVSGAEAILFNPARFSAQTTQGSVSANFSPTWSKYETPFSTPNQSQESENNFSPVFGLGYGQKVNDQVAVGAGYYVVGGDTLEYKNLLVPGTAVTTNFKSNTEFTEAALGASYAIAEGLSVGIAWRISFFNGELTGAPGLDAANTSIDVPEYNDLKATDFGGFRLGLNYAPTEDWGVGLVYRNEVELDSEGSYGGAKYNPATGAQVGSVDGAGSATEIEFVLPQQITLGGHYKTSETFTVFGQYSWTEYSVVDEVAVSVAGIAGSSPTRWKDQHTFRIAGEYSGTALPIRFGYIYSSQVTPESYATLITPPPGAAHTVALGTGWAASESLRLDGALEYYYSKGDVTANDQVTAGQPVEGEYSTVAFPTVHLGATYSF